MFGALLTLLFYIAPGKILCFSIFSVHFSEDFLVAIMKHDDSLSAFFYLLQEAFSLCDPKAIEVSKLLCSLQQLLCFSVLFHFTSGISNVILKASRIILPGFCLSDD